MFGWKRLCFGVVGAGLMLAQVIAFAQKPIGTTAFPVDSASSEDAWVRTIRSYRNWSKLNETPARMDAAVAAACAPAHFPGEVDKKHGPHGNSFITVYANDLARSVVVQGTPVFPVGAVVVKEKLQPGIAQPMLLTVMAKREPGFDAEHGDWEYFTLTGDAAQVTSRGKLGTCLGCHEVKKSADYVFFNYITGRDFDRLRRDAAPNSKQ